MNILITGDIGSGKSTLVSRVVERLGLKIQGFVTRPLVEDGKRIGFYIAPVTDPNGGNPEEKRIRMVGKIIGYKKVMAYPEVFNTWGCAYLKEALASGGVIVMDELGLIERQAHGFQQCVAECLDSSGLVIAVLRDASDPFLDSIRSREDVRLFRNTVETRDKLVDEVCSRIERFYKEEEIAHEKI